MGGFRGVFVPAVASTAVALAASLLIGANVDDGAPQDGMSRAERATETAPPMESSTAPLAEPSDDPAVTPPRPEDLPSLGIQFHGTWAHYDDAKRDAVLDRIEESGSTWVRLDVSWAMIQPTPYGFDETWGVPLVDDVMDSLRERGLKVLVMFWRSPAWASGVQDDEHVSPIDPADYAQALGWSVRRWGDVVDAWEIWNEPNLKDFYEGTDPKQYADLLCAANGAVQRNDPEAQVVFGGLVFSDSKWLERSYAAGVKGCFDVLAVHTYSVPGDLPPSKSDTGQEWELGHLRVMEETMREQGDPHPIWLTEFGWSAHDNWSDIEPWRRGVTLEQQAEYAAETLRILAEDLPFVTHAFWYKDVVNDSSTDVHQEGYAMLGRDLEPRPVFDAFRDLYAGG